MSYKLTYTGQQVQDYLDKIATGQVGGGTEDYNELLNKPIINADLDNTAASTADQTVLYHHVGESTAIYNKAAIYYTDGTNWLQFKGEIGLTALEYGDIHVEEYEGDIADEAIYLDIKGFNRTPVVDDNFLLVFRVTESGNTYIATFTITEVLTDTAKASVNVLSIQQINGNGGGLIARTQEDFYALLVVENIGMTISYNGDLYIVDVLHDDFSNFPLAVGDKISELHFDTSKTPDLYAVRDDLLIQAGTVTVDGVEFPIGLQVWGLGDAELLWLSADQEFPTIYRQENKEEPSGATEFGWLVDSITFNTAQTVTAVNNQDIWSDYIKVKYASKVYAKKIASVDDTNEIDARLDSIEAQIGTAVQELATI